MSTKLDDFDVLGTIGEGTFGCCRKIRRRKDRKEMTYGTLSEGEKQLIVSEVNLLRRLRHQHIVRYYDRIVDRDTSIIYIIMEYCEGGDLSSMIRKWKRQKTSAKEEFIWRTLAQLCQALQLCHSRRGGGRAVIHRDLKPANVFLDSDQNVKLGDFGLARILTDKNMAKTFVGTPYYMSPEQVMFAEYNEKSDIWSLGCLTYEMAALHPPFLARNQSELAVKIRKGRFPRIPQQYSDSLQRIIDIMLRVDEHLRPNVDYLIGQPEIRHHLTPDVECHLSSSSTKEQSLEKRDSTGQKTRNELRKWEISLLEKEKCLLIKESELEKRERSVARLEENIQDKLKRLDRAQTLSEERERRLNHQEMLDNSRGLVEAQSGHRKRRVIAIGGPIKAVTANTDILNHSPRLRNIINSQRRSSKLSPVFQLI